MQFPPKFKDMLLKETWSYITVSHSSYIAIVIMFYVHSSFCGPFDFCFFAWETNISFSYVLYIETSLQSYITVSSIILKWQPSCEKHVHVARLWKVTGRWTQFPCIVWVSRLCSKWHVTASWVPWCTMAKKLYIKNTFLCDLTSMPPIIV